MTPGGTTEAELRAAVAGRDWYHTIELPHGIVTPGQFDTRKAVGRIPFPESLEGKRCLDVGTSDGFWAFEMERRGAAEVLAVDVDDPRDYDWPGLVPPIEAAEGLAHDKGGFKRNFDIPAAALGSAVERVPMKVYDISPERLGEFDFVFMGSLLLHLRDPVAALAAIRTVTRGEFLSGDSISMWTTLFHPRIAAGTFVGENFPRWWTPNLVAYRRMIRASGFQIVDTGGPYFIPWGPGQFKAGWHPRDLDFARILFNLTVRRTGIPCAWAVCRR